MLILGHSNKCVFVRFNYMMHVTGITDLVIKQKSLKLEIEVADVCYMQDAHIHLAITLHTKCC